MGVVPLVQLLRHRKRSPYWVHCCRGSGIVQNQVSYVRGPKRVDLSRHFCSGTLTGASSRCHSLTAKLWEVWREKIISAAADAPQWGATARVAEKFDSQARCVSDGW